MGFGLLPFRSPLLRECLLVSFPPGTEMFHFPGLRGNLGIKGCYAPPPSLSQLRHALISQLPRHPPSTSKPQKLHQPTPIIHFFSFKVQKKPLGSGKNFQKASKLNIQNHPEEIFLILYIIIFQIKKSRGVS